MFIQKILCSFLIFSAFSYGEGINNAGGYHKNSTLQWNAASPILDSINWEGTEKVLDVGCGDGKITAFIAEHLTQSSVVGVDVSQVMIQFASKNYTHNHLGASVLERLSIS